jgi:hypothetical protein
MDKLAFFFVVFIAASAGRFKHTIAATVENHK